MVRITYAYYYRTTYYRKTQEEWSVLVFTRYHEKYLVSNLPFVDTVGYFILADTESSVSQGLDMPTPLTDRDDVALPTRGSVW